MGIKVNKTTLALFFVLFFLTVFFQGCSTTRSDSTFGPPPVFGVGFPFTYIDDGDAARIERIDIIWWALFLNIFIFTVLYKYMYVVSENLIFKIYTYILIIIHILFGMSVLITYMGILNHFLSIKPIFMNPFSFYIAIILSIVLFIFGYIKHLESRRNPANANNLNRTKYLFFALGCLVLLPYASILTSYVFIGYLFSFGIIGRIITSFIPILGAGQATFMTLWLPFFIYLFLKTRNNDNIRKDSSKNRSNNKALRKKLEK